MTTVTDAPCPKCGSTPVPPGFVVCLGCAVGLDAEALGRVRGELAEHLEREGAWLVEAETMLTEMAPDDPRYARGRAKWEERRLAYEKTARNHGVLCWVLPS